MTILARIVRFLLWLLVLSLSVRALRRLFGLLLENRGSSPQHAAKGSASPPPTKTGRHLVRDPVCGMYVDETLSIPMREDGELDRKSTRLNSSHGYISYAVFCLKKKNTSSTDPLIRHTDADLRLSSAVASLTSANSITTSPHAPNRA